MTSKRVSLQTTASVFMVLLTMTILILCYLGFTEASTDLEKGFLLGVSFLIMGEMVYLYNNAFGQRVNQLIVDKDKVGVVYDEEELYKELVEIVGEGKVSKNKKRILEIMMEDSDLYKESREVKDESSS